MTRERQLLIAVGAALIGLIIAIAAFSLGVYVGIHGWTAGPPSVAGPGPQQPRLPGDALPEPGAPDQAAPRPNAALPAEPLPPGPRPQVVGQVRSVSGDSLTVNTPQGPRLCQLAPNVRVFRVVSGEEVPATLAEVVPGEHLAVFGRIEGDGARQLVAVRLLLLP